MAAGRDSSRGLAARIVMLTLFIGVSTVLAAGIVAVVSTSRLSLEKAAGRELVLAQLIEDRVEGRLRTVDTVVERVSTIAAESRDEADAEASLSTVYRANDTLFDRFIVADRRGRVIHTLPLDPSVDSVGRYRAFREALTGQTGFSVERTEDGRWTLWNARTIVSGSGVPVVVLARVDTAFLEELLAEASETVPDHSMLLLDGENVLVKGGDGPPLDLSQARWRPGTPSSGQIVVRAADGTPMNGLYNDVQGLNNIVWRVVITQPAALATRDTFSAVTPSIAVLLVGGSIAVVAAWVVSMRLVRPLRDLEFAARTAASGAYVRPISADRDDEIGRVAEAFNAVTLRLNALHDLSQLIASASRLDQVLDGILSAMGHIVGPGASAVFLLSADGERLAPERARGVEMGDLTPLPASGNGWLASALEASDPIVTRGDVAAVRTELPGLVSDRTEVLAAPLVAGRDALGVVVVALDSPVPVSEAELEMVRTFSAQAAVAVQTSRLFEEETESRRVAEALRQVAQELVRPDGLAAALSRVEEIVASLFSASVVRIVLIDRPSLGLPPSDDRAGDAEAIGVALRALSAAESTEGAEIARGEDPSADALLERLGVRRLLVTPISLDTDRGAVMLVGFAERDGRGGESEISRAVGDEVALALDNAYFYERAVARAANLETIFRISQAVGSSLQVNVVLNRVLDVVQKILSADAVVLLSYDARRRALSTSMARGMVPGSLLHIEVGVGDDVPGHVYVSGQPVALLDMHPGMDGVARMAAEHDLRSMLAVPLLARGRSIGVLMVFSTHPGAFTDEDLNVLQTFASQAALAIDTARLYSREHEVSSVLQQSLLPEALPDFPELEAGSVYAPAGGDVDIGGDYYDVFRGPSAEIWLAIADVCGKGVQAATKTSMIKYAVRALVAAGLGPGDVVGEVNRLTAEAGEVSDIVTLLVARYDAPGGRLSWANGGHPPGVVLRADGTMARLEVTGPLLGAVADHEYEQCEIGIAAGDRVLLFTDGVTEARQGNTFFGEQRAIDAFGAPGSSAEIARRVVDEVRRFVQGDLRDDVAVLAVKVRDMDAASPAELAGEAWLAG